LFFKGRLHINRKSSFKIIIDASLTGVIISAIRKSSRPSLPLKKAFFNLSVSPARRAPLSPQAPLPQEAGM